MSINIKLARIRNRLTQEQLARLIHVSPYTVRMWEQGKASPSAGNLVALSNELGCTADYLLGRTNMFNQWEED